MRKNESFALYASWCSATAAPQESSLVHLVSGSCSPSPCPGTEILIACHPGMYWFLREDSFSCPRLLLHFFYFRSRLLAPRLRLDYLIFPSNFLEADLVFPRLACRRPLFFGECLPHGEYRFSSVIRIFDLVVCPISFLQVKRCPFPLVVKALPSQL